MVHYYKTRYLRREDKDAATQTAQNSTVEESVSSIDNESVYEMVPDYEE